MSKVISGFQTQFPTLIPYCTLIPSNYSTVLACNCPWIRGTQTSKGNLCHTSTQDRESASATVTKYETQVLNCLIALTFGDDVRSTAARWNVGQAVPLCRRGTSGRDVNECRHRGGKLWLLNLLNSQSHASNCSEKTNVRKFIQVL